MDMSVEDNTEIWNFMEYQTWGISLPAFFPLLKPLLTRVGLQMSL